MNIPIVIVGTGRSGSTALHRLLSYHPHLAWLSGLCNRFPRKPQINRKLMLGLDVPFLDTLLRRKYAASEAYEFWQQYSRGFGRPCRDLTASDVTNREKRMVKKAMESCLTKSRSRLLLKVTGWPRIGYLAEIFPDAKFIHMVRDGRAVANSMLAVPFWDGWHGPERWRWDRLSDDQHSTWQEFGRSFVALAGFEWVMMQQAFENATRNIPTSQYLEIRYEDFCDDRTATMRKIIQFAELEWNKKFEDVVLKYSTTNTNFKWQSDLTTDQLEILENVERPYLAKYGYI